ncbi:metallophosphoesterase [Paraburkholderia diazotrophica]|uniref:Calcineurin-like phosphoesterase n=1 Tax=Paraburkholderia diazotrophica TaxID=667676 RepID=A0A1H7E6F8_9BURK|nr:metallophosphoesterase [Paraburkholderia diazotrophica]SEK07240.1 Calcineurin-like phosphoesterase [Paraburkholderia diazotrophica]
MRFQVASDLHLEMLSRRFPGYRIIEPAADADALILAGDIHSHTRALDAFSCWPVPVVCVHGNHEPMSAHYWGIVRELARKAQGGMVRYLEQSVFEMDDVRVLGCCLWADYDLGGRRATSMSEAARAMPDHQFIRVGGGQRFLPSHALAEHQKARRWLEAELARPWSGKTIVVTHHAPHPRSLGSRFADDILNGAFATDLSPLLKSVDLWVHGHTHVSVDFNVGRCRVVCNAAGYARNVRVAVNVNELLFENESFVPSLVIEV